jgi:SAM-dependent methyltransferase
VIATATRLNFACGNTRWPGFENSDIVEGDVYCDLEDHPYPYGDDTAELVMISHGLQFCVEGCQPAHPDLEPIMREFHRILKPGGWLRIDDSPVRIYRNGEMLDGHEIDLDVARGFPVHLRSDRDDFISMLHRIGFDPVLELDPASTRIPCDTEMSESIVANHGGHFSFAIEAHKCQP